jgi:magnesium-transporting ATPase (P-type)
MIITSSKCRPQNNEERFWLTVSPYQIRLSSFCNRSLPRIAELPFDPDRKRMTTVHAIADTGLGPCTNRRGCVVNSACALDSGPRIRNEYGFAL